MTAPLAAFPVVAAPITAPAAAPLALAWSFCCGDSDEAACIRASGFAARKGLWRCPAIPWEFLGRYPPLWHLSDDLDPACRPAVWHPKRAAILPRPQSDALGKFDCRLLTLLERPPGQGLRRYELQRKLWRIPAMIFNHVLNRLIAEDRVTAHGGRLYPFSRRELDLRFDLAAQSRRPVLRYTIP